LVAQRFIKHVHSILRSLTRLNELILEDKNRSKYYRKTAYKLDISIIIVSYNTAKLLMDCLASLQAATGVEKEVFVVDNCSIDGSAKMVAEHFPEIKLIINTENRGFGTANNQALSFCTGRYVAFLNPDTVIKSDALQQVVAFMDVNQHVGLAGSKILNPDGTTQESVSYKYPGETNTAGETDNLKGNIASVMGAFMITRKELLQDIGGFDEDFFLYGEDQDLCWKIRQQGFYIGYIEDAKVTHWGGQSEAQTLPAALFAKKIKAEYLFYAKHYNPETIARIKKVEKLKAIFRLITLKISLPFSQEKKLLQNKIDRYQLIYNMTKL